MSRKQDDDELEDWRSEWEIPLDAEGPCDWCGEAHPLREACDSSLFDADELGLDPEEDDTRGQRRRDQGR